MVQIWPYFEPFLDPFLTPFWAIFGLFQGLSRAVQGWPALERLDERTLPFGLNALMVLAIVAQDPNMAQKGVKIALKWPKIGPFWAISGPGPGAERPILG